MTRLVPLAFVLIFAALPALADRIDVQPGDGALARALWAARAGDEIVLASGHYAGPVHIEIPLTLTGTTGAIIDAGGVGSVVTVDAPDVTIQSLTLINSGRVHEPGDAGVKLTQKARGAQVLNNDLKGNLIGVDIHGARDALVQDNRIEGLQLSRMNDRGNGVYVWNAPGSIVKDNDIRYGRDGIFSNVSKHNIYRGNLFRDLRFAVHYMYTNDSEISGNVSIGNHLGFAMMYSDRIVARDNISINDRDYGVMLNYTNKSDIFANQVSGGAEKCAFVYNSHNNLLAENSFNGCDIGIHFTAGSERNTVTGNAFIGNHIQVKYVGASDVEWSFEGRGNFWSDHPSFDLNGDDRADSTYRPNDVMDHILWSQPAAKLLIGSPAVQLVRWSQEQFPATAIGGVIDSHPLIVAPKLTIPQNLLLLAQSTPHWATGASHDDATDFQPD
ncbi:MULTISPECIES: nitrous oxide reductase family maturation protein NosD [Roseobacteraceae]|uniref:nitrous oxide reductase family maturation protein NosD n=1 Tax=Roseobacteraceae TaxID=2854170 RepID=UPI00125ECAF4|nr:MULTISPECIES: nitrous oxide reductase family maturation protein NosD [Roseobacteraceae]KAB6715530.1 nitrous oxide reductase family maturation protein NosD [Roseobacter sp. TSBP12]|tara:strand:- start:23154 stop:24482 length:1329 start_codon:yes stop_codon:yes gene_type:complete